MAYDRPYERPFDGHWFYTKKGGEYGIYYAIGFINDQPAFEFAWYESRGGQRFSSMGRLGYTLGEKMWGDQPKTKYVYYSKYLPLQELQGSNFREQEEQILQFVNRCIVDLKAKVPGKRKASKPTPLLLSQAKK